MNKRLRLTATPNVPGPGCNIEHFRDILLGCDCTDGCSTSSCSCQPFGVNFEPDGRLLFSLNSTRPIRECGSDCQCSGQTSICMNRVVQRGPLACLQIFEAFDKGSGVITNEEIVPQTFVCEYVGEIIDQNEAERRIRSQCDQAHNYIYAVQEHISSQPDNPLLTIIDGRNVEAIGKYINHSCEPNLTVLVVRYDNSVPKIAFFANRTINVGEELSYSYVSTSARTWQHENDVHPDNLMIPTGCKICLCGAKNCIKFLPKLVTPF